MSISIKLHIYFYFFLSPSLSVSFSVEVFAVAVRLWIRPEDYTKVFFEYSAVSCREKKYDEAEERK